MSADTTATALDLAATTNIDDITACIRPHTQRLIAMAMLDALGIEHDAVPVGLIDNLRMVHRGDEPAEPEGENVQAYRVNRKGQ